MTYLPTRPAPGQIEKIRLKFWVSFALIIVFLAIMSSLPTPVVGLGLAGVVLIYNIFQAHEWFHNSLSNGDIWRMNMRKNIEAKYDIELPRIPDVTQNDFQPLKFSHQRVEYTMLFNQDNTTFEPFIFPDASYQGHNPEKFLRTK